MDVSQVSQTAVQYRESPLSEGRAGMVHGGDRLPWVRMGASRSGAGTEDSRGDGVADNFAPLTSLEWQPHVYGEASGELRAVCEARKLPLHVFPWRPAMSRAGLRRNATYLVRPDGYVALAAYEASGAAVAAYLDARKIKLEAVLPGALQIG